MPTELLPELVMQSDPTKALLPMLCASTLTPASVPHIHSLNRPSLNRCQVLVPGMRSRGQLHPQLRHMICLI